MIKEGDIVEAVRSVNADDPDSFKRITKGKHYTVIAIGGLTGAIMVIDDAGIENTYIKSRFKKVKYGKK